MSTTVMYNTVTLSEVRIHEYRVDSPASFDTPSTGILRHYVSGEALWIPKQGDTWDKKDDSWGRQFVVNLRELLNTPRRSLEIKIKDDAGEFILFKHGGNNLDIKAYPDENNGPFFRATVTQITGTSALLVNFTCEWADSGDAGIIRSFFCATTFTIDELGNTTIRKMGSLRMKAQPQLLSNGSLFGVKPTNTDRAGTSDTGRIGGDGKRTDVVTDFVVPNSQAAFPDQYRRFISGNLYPGFRRIRQEYAHDESRNTLVFDIVDQEFSRGMPAPARVGNCQFTFEREMGNGTQMIGTKHFIASVKGDKFVTAGALLTLCIRLSQNRIDYIKDTIVKIRVTEENMLTENAITFEVLATATSAQQFTPNTGGDIPVGTSGGTGSLIDQSLLLKNILGPIALANGAFQFVPALQSDAYGNSLIVRVTPGAFENKFPYGADKLNESTVTTYQLGSFDSVVYQFPRAYFDGQDPGNDPYGIYIEKGSPAVPFGPNKGDGQHNATDAQGNPVVANPPLHSKGGKKIEVKSNIIVVPSVCPDGKPMLFQVGNPVVVETEFIDGARKNEPPSKTFNEQTAGSITTAIGFNITSGVPDMNGNRVMVAGYDRTTVTTSPGDFNSQTGKSITNPSFKKTEGVFGGKTYNIVVFNPESIKMPLDGTQGAQQPEYTGGLGNPEEYLA